MKTEPNNYKVVNRKDNEVLLFEGSFTLCTLHLTDRKWNGLGYVLCEIKKA